MIWIIGEAVNIFIQYQIMGYMDCILQVKKINEQFSNAYYYIVLTT